jgi:hypothetical protein
MISAFQENGPCLVNADSSTLRQNPWSWTGVSNMLYIDQPVQTGFSYDSLVNGTVDQLKGGTPKPWTSDKQMPESNTTFYTGLFASQETSQTANTT